MKAYIILFFLLLLDYQSIGQNNIHLYNSKGKVKQTLSYDVILPGSGDYLVVSKEGDFGIYNYKKKELTVDLLYRDVEIFPSGFATVKDKKERWGLIQLSKTANDNNILPFQFYKMIYLNDRYLSIVDANNQCGVFDVLEKRFVIDCQYDTRITMQDEVFVIRHQAQYGLFDQKGGIVLPFQKQHFKLNPEHHLVSIRRNNSTLLFNTETLEYQSELEFETFPIVFEHGFALVQKNGKFGFLAISGQMITALEYSNASTFNEFGFAKVEQNGTWGVIDQTGKIVLPLQFSSKENCPTLYQNGWYLEYLNADSVGIKCLDGTWLLPPNYHSLMIKKNYFTAIKQDKSFYLLNKNGQILQKMPPNQSIEPVGTLYRLSENDHYGWLNSKFELKGTIGIGFLNNFETPEVTTVFKPTVNKYGIVNKNGDFVLPIQYAAIDLSAAAYNILFVQTNDKKWGAYNLKGKLIIETKYRKKIDLQNGWSLLIQ